MVTETRSLAIPQEVQQAAHELLHHAQRKSVTFTTAESCTGGLLASMLTAVEGASSMFERGFVVYSTEAKCELLGIERKAIEDCGAVSAKIARAMARGALRRSHADIALATTGYAGALGADGEPGLVYLACARHDKIVREREEHFGDVGRDAVRIATVWAALQMMMEALH